MKNIFSRITRRIPLSLLAVGFISCFLISFSFAQIKDLDKGPPPPIQDDDSFQGKIHSDLIKGAKEQATLKVIVYLKDQPAFDISQQTKESYRPEMNRLSAEMRDLMRPFDLNNPLPPNVRQQAKNILTRHDSLTNDMRKEIYQRVRNQVSQQQDALQQFIEQNLGGTVSNRITLVNALAMSIPSSQLENLSNHPGVASIEPDRPVHPCLNSSVPSIGASTWWDNGHDGGVYDIGMIDSGLFFGVWEHPDLISHDILSHTTVGTSTRDNDPEGGHGTPMTGVVCSTNSTYKGVAFGLDKIINSKAWEKGVGGSESTVMAAVEWAINGASDDADVINYSGAFGEMTEDYSGFARFFDAVVDDLDVPVALCSGNWHEDMNPNAKLEHTSYNAIIGGDTIKALLINTADKPAHPSDTEEWNELYGWGAINLTEAYNNRSNWSTFGVYPNGNPRDTYWFKGYMRTGDRATLVWKRHATYNGASYPTSYASELNDIDLRLYDYTGDVKGSKIDDSLSGIDNVEQVRMTWPDGQVIIKVSAYDSSFDYVSAEWVTLATPLEFTSLTSIPVHAPLLAPSQYQANCAPSSFEICQNGQVLDTIETTVPYPHEEVILNTSLPDGVYNITAKSYKFLRAVKTNVTVEAGMSRVEFSELLGGDSDNNNFVDASDFGTLAYFFGEVNGEDCDFLPQPDDPPSAWNADFDGSGTVDGSDFGTLAYNFGEAGDDCTSTLLT